MIFNSLKFLSFIFCILCVLFFTIFNTNNISNQEVSAADPVNATTQTWITFPSTPMPPASATYSCSTNSPFLIINCSLFFAASSPSTFDGFVYSVSNCDSVRIIMIEGRIPAGTTIRISNNNRLSQIYAQSGSTDISSTHFQMSKYSSLQIVDNKFVIDENTQLLTLDYATAIELYRLDVASSDTPVRFEISRNYFTGNYYKGTLFGKTLPIQSMIKLDEITIGTIDHDTNIVAPLNSDQSTVQLCDNFCDVKTAKLGIVQSDKTNFWIEFVNINGGMFVGMKMINCSGNRLISRSEGTIGSVVTTRMNPFTLRNIGLIALNDNYLESKLSELTLTVTWALAQGFRGRPSSGEPYSKWKAITTSLENIARIEMSNNFLSNLDFVTSDSTTVKVLWEISDLPDRTNNPQKYFVRNITAIYSHNNTLNPSRCGDEAFAFFWSPRIANYQVKYFSIKNNKVYSLSSGKVYAVFVEAKHHMSHYERVEVSNNIVNANQSWGDSGLKISWFVKEDAPWSAGGVVHFYLIAAPEFPIHQYTRFPDSATYPAMKIHIFNNTLERMEVCSIEAVRCAFWNITFQIDEVHVYNNVGNDLNIRRANQDLEKTSYSPLELNDLIAGTLLQITFDLFMPVSSISLHNNSANLRFVANPKSLNPRKQFGMRGIFLVLQKEANIRHVVIDNNSLHLIECGIGDDVEGMIAAIDVILPPLRQTIEALFPGILGPVLIRNNNVSISDVDRCPVPGCLGITVRRALGTFVVLEEILIENNTIIMRNINSPDYEACIGLIGLANVNGLSVTPAGLFSKVPGASWPFEIIMTFKGNATMIFLKNFTVRGNFMRLEVPDRDYFICALCVVGDMTYFQESIVFESNDIMIRADLALNTKVPIRLRSPPSAALIRFDRMYGEARMDQESSLNGKIPYHGKIFVVSNSSFPFRAVVQKKIILSGNRFELVGGFISTICTYIQLTVREGIEVSNSSFDVSLSNRASMMHTFLRRFEQTPVRKDGIMTGPGNSTLRCISLSTIKFLNHSSYTITSSSSYSSSASSNSYVQNSNEILNSELPQINLFGVSRDDFNISIQELTLVVDSSTRVSFILNGNTIQDPSLRSIPTPSILRIVPTRLRSPDTSYDDDNDNVLNEQGRKVFGSFYWDKFLQVNFSLMGNISVALLKSSTFGSDLQTYSGLLASNFPLTNSIAKFSQVEVEMFGVSSNDRIPIVSYNDPDFSNSPSSSPSFFPPSATLPAALIEAVNTSFAHSSLAFELVNRLRRQIGQDQSSFTFPNYSATSAIAELQSIQTPSQSSINISSLSVSSLLNGYHSILQIPTAPFASSSSSRYSPSLFAKCVSWNKQSLRASSNFGIPTLLFVPSTPLGKYLAQPKFIKVPLCNPLGSPSRSLSQSISRVPQCAKDFILQHLGAIEESPNRGTTVRELQYYQQYFFSVGIIFKQDQDRRNVAGSYQFEEGEIQSQQFTVFKDETVLGNSRYSPERMKRSVTVVSTSFSSSSSSTVTAAVSVPSLYINQTYATSQLATLKIQLLVGDASQLNEYSDLAVTIRVGPDLLACESTSFTDISLAFSRQAPALSAQAIQVIRSASNFASVMTSMTGSSMVAPSNARSLMLGRYIDCMFDPQEEPLEFELSPLGWAVGRESSRFLRGAVVGNGFLVFIMTFALMVFVAGYLWMRQRKRRAEWLKRHPDGVQYITMTEHENRETTTSTRNDKKVFAAGNTKVRVKGPPSVLNWRKFKMSLLSIGATSMLHNLTNVLVQGSVSASVSLILYGPTESKYIDRTMGVMTVLISFGIGLYMIWVLIVELPNRPGIKYFYNEKYTLHNHQNLQQQQQRGKFEGEEELSDSPDEAEILKFLLHVPSKECPTCAAERTEQRERVRKMRRERTRKNILESRNTASFRLSSSSFSNSKDLQLQQQQQPQSKRGRGSSSSLREDFAEISFRSLSLPVMMNDSSKSQSPLTRGKSQILKRQTSSSPSLLPLRDIRRRESLYKGFFKALRGYFEYYGNWKVVSTNSLPPNNEQQKEARAAPRHSLASDKKFFLFANDVFRDSSADRPANLWFPTFLYWLQFSLSALQGYAPAAKSSSCRGFGIVIAMLNCLPLPWMLAYFPFRHWLTNFYTIVSSFVIAFQAIALLVSYLDQSYDLSWVELTSEILNLGLSMLGIMMMFLDLILVFCESPYFVVYIVRRLRHLFLHRFLVAVSNHRHQDADDQLLLVVNNDYDEKMRGKHNTIVDIVVNEVENNNNSGEGSPATTSSMDSSELQDDLLLGNKIRKNRGAAPKCWNQLE